MALMKKTESVSAAALILACSILLSRVLGYVREMLLAYQFGTGTTTDAFYAAFQIPDLLNYFLAGGALSIAFIPLYNKVLARDGEEAAHKLMSTVLGTLGLLVVIVTGLLWWKAEALIRFQFPKFDADTTAQTVFLTRIVLPAQIFFITGGIVQAVLLAHRNFHAAALAPLIYNVCIIAGGFFLAPYYGIAGFAVGTLLGSILGPFLMPILYSRKHIPLRARVSPGEKNFLVYLALAAPLMFGQTLLTLDEWYGRWFGALLDPGTVAAISYARRLMQVPIAVIGQALAAAALPTLSKMWAENKQEDLNRTLLQTLRSGLALAVFGAAGFFVLAPQLVQIVYQHGAFTAEDTLRVSRLVGILAFAVPAWILQQISVRAFYARGDTWRPMVLGTLLSIAVIPLYLHLSGIKGVEGLAMAGVLGMTLNALATLVYARFLHGAPSMGALAMTFLRSLLIAAAAGLAAHNALYARGKFWADPGLHQKWIAVMDLALGGAAFGLIALPAIFIFGDRDLRDYIKKVLKR